MPRVRSGVVTQGIHRLKQIAILSAVLLLAACASETQRREGMSLIMEGRYEEGLAQLEQVSQKDPKDTEARSNLLRQREQAVNRILNMAHSEQANERFDAAEALYNRALNIDPGSPAARSGLLDVAADRRHAKWFSEAQAMVKKGDMEGAKATVGLILVEQPGHVKANQLRYQLEEQTLKSNLAGPRLNIKGRKPVTLQFRDANLKMVLEAIARTTSLNILVDKDVRNDIKVTIFVKDTPVEETLDLILLQNQLEKRILGENTVLIYPLNANKSKDYQELKVRRFALVNADPKQVQSMIKTILKTKDVYVDERSGAVVIRDTPQVIRLAEKLVNSMDLPEPEVMLEVELLDVDRTRALDLGIDWPTAFAATWPLSGTTATLAALHHITAATVAVSGLSVTANAKGSDSDTRTLATPRIRVRNKEKAKIMIGARTPVISSAAVPGTTAGVSAVFNTSIQYLETGVKLEVEPTVYLDGNVAIKVALEVSDLGTKTVTDSGTVAYATTTNNATTVLRLKDGETQVLGGLLRAFDSHGQANKTPGLGDIPFFGRLFGSGSDSWQNRELVLAITPHIIRNNQVSEADLLELWSGTEANIKDGESVLNAAGSAGVISQGLSGTSEPRTSAMAPIRHQAPADSEVKPVVADIPAAVPVPAAEVTSGTLAARLTGPQQAKVGDKINVAVTTQGAATVNTVTFAMQYDPEVLKAISVTEGSLMRNTGAKSTFDGDIDETGGRVVAVLATEVGSAGGNGTVASIQFEVVGAQRPAVISVSSITATNDKSAAVAVSSPAPLAIAVQQQP